MNQVAPLHKLFFYLFVLSIPIQLSYHFWPEWAMVLGRRVDYLSPTVYISDLLLFCTLFTWIYANRKNLNIYVDNLIKKHWTLGVLMGLFATAILLTTSSLPSSILGLIKIIEMTMLLFYIYRSNASFLMITKLLIISSLFSIALGVIQIIHNGSLGGFFWLLGERAFNTNTPNIAKSFLCLPLGNICLNTLRPYATFPHPNIFAGFLCFTLIATQIFHKNIHLSKIITFILFLGIFLTGSRNVLFYSLFIFGLMQIKKLNNPTTIRVVVGCLLIFSTLVSILLTYPPSFGFQRYINSYESGVVRQQLNLAAVEMFKSSPVYGTGLHTFLWNLPEFLVYKTVYFLQPVHNIYLLTLSSIGLVGVGLILAAIFYVIKQNKNNFPQTKIFLPLLFFLCIGFFDHYPISLQQGQLVFTLAIAFVFTRKNSI